jgi:hypothetical protein
MQTWLDAHGIEAVRREEWEVPSADAVKDAVEREEKARPARKNRAAHADASRQRLRELVELLPVRELDMAVEFLEFLRERRPVPRMKSKAPDRAGGEDETNGDSEPPSSE